MTLLDDPVYALDFSAWKRPYVKLCFPGSVIFVDHVASVPVGATLLIWGRREVPRENLYQVRRVEDGFLRSVGLGADLVRPLSWVMDDQGMYFDATRPSRLENILEKHVFDQFLLEKAQKLREKIVVTRLSKYNVGSSPWVLPVAGRRVVLVPGQVESDASLAFGAPGICRNRLLLQEVRRLCPDDYIIYKPHPDVVAGMRLAGEGENSALQWCDEVVTDVSVVDLLDVVDVVHVMTSLTGFEALLRGKKVICHGLPFYAGWGLTEDVLVCVRRTRRLTLDELVAGALLLYPIYFDRQGKQRVTAEAALDELLAWRAQTGGQAPWWRVFSRMALRWVVGVR